MVSKHFVASHAELMAEMHVLNCDGLSERSAPGVMLVTSTLQELPVGGRALLSRLTCDALAEVFGVRFSVFELQSSRLRGLGSIAGVLAGHIDGLDGAVIAKVIHTIQERKIRKVVIDGSNLGALVKAIKMRCPGVEVTTFFHNCEARFFLGAFREFRTLHSLGVLISNYLAERRAVRHSDKLICLNERDSGLLRKLYGRGATHISAMAMQDSLPTSVPSRNGPASEKYALFVGGTFYANRSGITWFARHVAPHLSIKTFVIGKGFEAFKESLERDGNVEVIGAVESLVPWYIGAHVVIAPIFDGSGMKTKVAEALMFGKKVIGTPEAFSGYEDIESRAGVVCSTADEFVNAIERLADGPPADFDPELRALYEEKYSYPAARLRLAEILELTT